MKRFLSIIFTFFIITNLYTQKKSKKLSIDSLTQKKTKSVGIITSYLDNNDELYLELSDSIFKKEILVVTRFVQLPSNYSGYINAGSKTSEQVVMFEKKGEKIFLRQKSFSNVANQIDPINISVTKNNLTPILASFKILNKEKNRYLIDVSSFFLKDSPGFNIIRKTERDKYKIGRADKNRSSIDSANSYPQNLEIKHTLTFEASKPPRGNNSKTLSFQINHSFIELPKNPMPVRYTDHRVGWFSVEKTNYSSQELKSDSYRIAQRWRLEPKDPEAYNNGELSEPVKQIIYYLDPATPIKWRKYFKQGIEDWNEAFEEAGFKNVVVAKDPPSKDKDPSFSPEDIRYSTVRYVASKTRNATGPRVYDPRTGEILESDVIWYHNHLRSYRNRYLIETGAANPKARTLDTPESEIGEMMRRVISHEVGHALGLPHNMKASSAYPVDSLRSGSFTQKYGIASTIMDYARYNYVAQPEDENIRFIRKIGPYDKYSINWGYRYFQNKNSLEIKSILEDFVDKNSLNPNFMFGYGGLDPNSQTENIGDDPVKATTYGIKNLKIVMKNLPEWTQTKNIDYEDLEEIYTEAIYVYRRYMYHVLNIVGGVYETRNSRKKDNINTYRNVSKEKQKEAILFLYKNLWKSQFWLTPKKITSKIRSNGIMERIENIQKSSLNRLLSVRKLNQILSSNSTVEGFGLNSKNLIQEIEKLIFSNSNPDTSEQNLQVYFIEKMVELIDDKKLHPSIKSFLVSLKKNLNKKFKRNTNKPFKAHYDYLYLLTKT